MARTERRRVDDEIYSGRQGDTLLDLICTLEGITVPEHTPTHTPQKLLWMLFFRLTRMASLSSSVQLHFQVLEAIFFSWLR